MIAANTLAAGTLAEVYALANAQFDSPEFKRLLATPFTMARARFFTIEMARYVANRRDCWGYVQGAAPLDVKRLIWEHEREELVLDPEVGTDHVTLATREARVLGLTIEDLERAERFPGSVVAFYAWERLARDRPWLEALAASSVLEVRNSGAVIKGGSLSARIRHKLVHELGLPAAGLINANRHAVADTAHAGLLETVVTRYVTCSTEQQAVLRGARESLLVDRAFRGALAAAMAALDSPE